MRPLPPTRRALRAVVLAGSFLVTMPSLNHATAAAAPTPGFREDFAGTLLTGWASGSTISNPGSGGMFGAADGFLLVAVPGPFEGNLGASGAESAMVGNWTAAGITQVRFWLNDVNAPDPLEIHFALGNGATGNFWQCNAGFVPPAGRWAPFRVDVGDSTGFSFIGSGAHSFPAAMAAVDRVLFRHDLAPYEKQPDVVIGDFGLDGVLLSDGVLGVDGDAPVAMMQPVRLAPPMPNPSRGPVTLQMDMAHAGTVCIQVVDALGRIVRHEELPARAPGRHAWTWNGADDRGVSAAAGYYRVRAIGVDGGTSQPLVRLP